MKELVNISTVKDGAIVEFLNSARTFMKVCDPRDGIGGIVDILSGRYLPVSELSYDGLNADECVVFANSIDEFYRDVYQIV